MSDTLTRGNIALAVALASTLASGPVLARPGDLAAILTNLDARDVLFIDEIHRLSTVVEETLYPALEDFRLDLIIGQGPTAGGVFADETETYGLLEYIDDRAGGVHRDLVV